MFHHPLALILILWLLSFLLRYWHNVKYIPPLSYLIPIASLWTDSISLPPRQEFVWKFVRSSTRRHLHTQLIYPCFGFRVTSFAYSTELWGQAEENLPLRFCWQGQPWHRAWDPILLRGSLEILSRMYQSAFFLGNCPRAMLRVTKGISEGMEK